MIEVDSLTKQFGTKTAVDHLSFAVNKGEVLGFLGPNGAGKSTTMRMITGFFPPTSGDAKVCGISIVDRPAEAKTKIGYLPESAPLLTACVRSSASSCSVTIPRLCRFFGVMKSSAAGCRRWNSPSSAICIRG